METDYKGKRTTAEIWSHLTFIFIFSTGLASSTNAQAQPSISRTEPTAEKEPEPFIPSSLEDPRLKTGNMYEPGSAMYKYEIQSQYSHALLNYAKKLAAQEKYKEALKLVDQAWNSEAKPSLEQAMDMHLALCLHLAANSSTKEQQNYYQLALRDSEKGIAGWHGLDYYIPKIKALLGLNRKKEAVACCEAAWRRAQSESKATQPYAEYLQKLTRSSKPKSPVDTRKMEEIHKDMMAYLQYTSCPPQKDIEKRIGTQFTVLFPNVPHMIRREFSRGSQLYKHGSLSIPHNLDGPSRLTQAPSPELGSLTEETVRHWLAPKEPVKEESPLTNSLIYEYPWGELEIAFSPFQSKSAYEWTFRWFKSSECDGMKDPFLEPQPSFEEQMQLIDRLLEKREFQQVLGKIEKAAGTATLLDRFPPQIERDAIRNRLIKLKELQNQPEIVAYLRIAPFKELVTMSHLILCGPRRSDFFTANEYADQKYLLLGKLDKEFNGHCEIIGFGGERIAEINEKTEAAQKLFTSFKVELPFDFTGKPGLEIHHLPGALLDQIAEEQEEIVSARVAQRNKLLKAKYDEDSKNPEIVKERERQARRKLLDPTKDQMMDAMLEIYKRQK